MNPTSACTAGILDRVWHKTNNPRRNKPKRDNHQPQFFYVAAMTPSEIWQQPPALGLCSSKCGWHGTPPWQRCPTMPLTILLACPRIPASLRHDAESGSRPCHQAPRQQPLAPVPVWPSATATTPAASRGAMRLIPHGLGLDATSAGGAAAATPSGEQHAVLCFAGREMGVGPCWVRRRRARDGSEVWQFCWKRLRRA